MCLIRRWLGIEELERRFAALESEVKKLAGPKAPGPEMRIPSRGLDERILGLLASPKTTRQLADELGMSRTWISLALNELERGKKVKEVGKRGRAILYQRV